MAVPTESMNVSMTVPKWLLTLFGIMLTVGMWIGSQLLTDSRAAVDLQNRVQQDVTRLVERVSAMDTRLSRVETILYNGRPGLGASGGGQ